MNESKLLSRKTAIYAMLALAMFALAALNFWGWFFIRGIEQQILRQLGRQLNNTGKVYALQISEKFLLWEASTAGEHILLLPENDLKLIPLQQLLYEFKETGELETLFIVSLDKQHFIGSEIDPASREQLRRFPLNDSLFRKAVLGIQPEAERIIFAGQYFLTAYCPIFDLAGEVVAVLVLEAPGQVFSTLQFFRRMLLYLGIGGLTVLLFFGAVIVVAIRRLFHAEEALHQQNRLAQLGQMAAMVAHEIRNPLSIIKGAAEVLQKKYASQGDELFAFIPEETNRLNRLVNDFLQFARRRNLHLEPANPAEIIALLLGQMNDPRIRAELGDATPSLKLDRDAFKQVLLNILENARQAIPAEGRVTIRARVSERPKCYRISIEDNGCGMSPETLQKIFDPFFSTRATGSGLGMAISKQLLEQMGGRIAVSSKENAGTTVTLEFPL